MFNSLLITISLFSASLMTLLVLAYFVIFALLLGKKVGLGGYTPGERALAYAFVVAFATICTIQIDLVLYLFFSMVMHTPLSAAQPVVGAILGGTFAINTVLLLALFFCGKHFKPELRLGAIGRFAFG